ncbi:MULTISPECIES: serine hydrolase [Asticcacaulis]|uniref:serine hydrolase domain-containing protein n=1 Tax=Asticcacaulis TaxID=76890 RepID=UPI001AE34CB3|nr:MULTISPECIES: serine hydrolase domain-containing protein [Asticcacaulis]MBP2160361.1 CubicO group peptidase (beta-lactamase class C family) [Asticcacaulis solisilvae]MDR6801336.1 CubicO group peptidase (beta-lactamase class C family) [Asticcacaulis sp. BE141]
MPRHILSILAALTVVSAPALAHAAMPVQTRQAFEAAADAVAQTAATSGNFSGEVLVAFDGKPVFRKAYGLADRTWNLPSRTGLTYRIGSTTKTFTAVAILQLAEAGKLSLDASVTTYIPDLPVSYRPITVRHLLSHSAGLPEFLSTTNSFTRLVRMDRTPEEVVALVRDLPLGFTPGERFSYSNTNYVALGLIIEKASGTDYATYVHDHILTPLGMTHTGYFDPSEIVPGMAQGYLIQGDRVANTFYMAPSMLYASGNLYSTADDLLIWDKALHTGKGLGLSESSRALLFRDNGFGYGYGVYVDKLAGEPYVGHPGTLPGYLTDYERFVNVPLTVVVLSNAYPVKVETMTRDLAGAFFSICGKTDARRACGLN